MHVGQYTRWFIDFAGTLFTTIKNPLHLIIDEAHHFMPQGKVPDPDTGKMLHAGNRLMSGGRSRGIRGMLITQRPAKLHKDSLTCADTLIAMRVIAPQDRSAIKDWIDIRGRQPWFLRRRLIVVRKPEGIGEFQSLLGKLARVPKKELDQAVQKRLAKKRAKKRKKKS